MAARLDPFLAQSTGGPSLPSPFGGKEIFFFSAPGYGVTNARLAAVPVQSTGATFEPGAPRELFDSGFVDLAHFSVTGANYHVFAVSPDGQRFLIPRPTAGPAPSTITVVLNWQEALTRQ